MSFVWCGVFFFGWHVVPIHTRLCFDLLPPHAGDAGQLHGCSQDCFCRWRDFHTYWLAQVNWKSKEMLHELSSAANVMEIQSKICFSSPVCLAFAAKLCLSRFSLYLWAKERKVNCTQLKSEIKLAWQKDFVASYLETNWHLAKLRPRTQTGQSEDSQLRPRFDNSCDPLNSWCVDFQLVVVKHF